MSPGAALSRIAVGSIQHESNSFCHGRTRGRDFETSPTVGPIRRGGAMLDELGASQWCLAGVLEACNTASTDVVPLLFAWAEPGPPVERQALEALTDELCAAMRKAGAVDAVILEQHGAMLTDGDVDGDSLVFAAVREVIGPDVPLVVTVDLHANLSADKLRHVDALVGYRTYPHVDLHDTGRRAYEAARRLAAGAERRVALRHLPDILPLNHQCTLDGIAADLYAALADVEARFPALTSLSLLMGFQQADIANPGASIVATGPGCDAAADALEAICRPIMAGATYDYLTVGEAARRVATAGGRPVVIADAQDNPGGGSSGDSVALARALLQEGVAAAVAMIPDPAAVAAAHAAGVGALIDIAVGGRSLAEDAPLAARFRVAALSTELVVIEGDMFNGERLDLGRTARLQTGTIELLVSEKRTQCLDPGFFRLLGLQPEALAVMVVKSAVHYRAGFGPAVFDSLNVAGPGLEVVDIRTLPYSRLDPGYRFAGHPLGAGPAPVRATRRPC